MRKSTIFFAFIGANMLILVLFFFHAVAERERAAPVLAQKAELVRTLGLTDLCLFTDARYTRHPSMADLNSAFQDHPFAFEHFPSGIIMTPPPHLRGN